MLNPHDHLHFIGQAVLFSLGKAGDPYEYEYSSSAVSLARTKQTFKKSSLEKKVFEKSV